jgi:hypothetical protein
MPAFDFALTLRTARRATLTLDEGQSLAIQIAHALQYWWGMQSVSRRMVSTIVFG